jgi:hypothetical protein
VNNDVRDMSDMFTEYGATNIHPAAAVFMFFMIAMVLWSRRSRVILAFLLVCVFMPMMQRIVVGGLDFNMMRLLLIVAWGRVFVRGEYRGFKPGKLDYLFVAWTASLAIFHVLRVGPGGIVYRLGTSFDALTVFFLFRLLVRRREEVLLIARELAWIVIVLGGFMAYEMATRINVFSIFGSAPLISVIRDGKVRCQGPFSHPILAGTFGAVLVPIFVGAFRGQRKERKLMAAALLFASITTVASGSSGPIITWGVGVFGWGVWLVRSRTRVIMGSLAGLAFVIHVVRDKPIWHLIGRLASVTGGTGYHRYLLVEAFISRFGEWALVGTSDTAHWGWGLQDTTNQYVAEGINGGLATLVLFVWLLATAFSWLRRTRILIERFEGPKSLWALLVWGFSVSLAAHCVSFVSVSYFGQMEQFFFLFLALVPALARFKRRPVQGARPVPERPALETSAARASPKHGDSNQRHLRSELRGEQRSPRSLLSFPAHPRWILRELRIAKILWAAPQLPRKGRLNL